MSQHAQWEDSFKMLDIILCIIFFYNAFKEEILTQWSNSNDFTASNFAVCSALNVSSKRWASAKADQSLPWQGWDRPL